MVFCLKIAAVQPQLLVEQFSSTSCIWLLPCDNSIYNRILPAIANFSSTNYFNTCVCSSVEVLGMRNWPNTSCILAKDSLAAQSTAWRAVHCSADSPAIIEAVQVLAIKLIAFPCSMHHIGSVGALAPAGPSHPNGLGTVCTSTRRVLFEFSLLSI